jgi:hypothetical protein
MTTNAFSTLKEAKQDYVMKNRGKAWLESVKVSFIKLISNCQAPMRQGRVSKQGEAVWALQR